MERREDLLEQRRIAQATLNDPHAIPSQKQSAMHNLDRVNKKLRRRSAGRALSWPFRKIYSTFRRRPC
ncbi:MAG: hypothetical protein JW744_00650 [Candidatus Diapherotrites archaeon]|uniref:Uncharacterized protein n=1 Tax=Candidatus Iainarchaeum sp. TaxID=3101447 RepID=A0A938YW74_9ARCH|nr:hypothetical protein [Candidatus Diapherotrites archaeon]